MLAADRFVRPQPKHLEPLASLVLQIDPDVVETIRLSSVGSPPRHGAASSAPGPDMRPSGSPAADAPGGGGGLALELDWNDD
jgi:hypothetical protein